MKRLLLATLLLSLTATTARAAASIEIGLNDFSAQGQYFQSITEDQYGSSMFDIRALYNDHQDTTLVSGGVDFLGKPGNIPGLDVGVGLLAYGGQSTHDPIDRDLAAIAIGARALYQPPALQGVGFGAKLFYAPQILSFADTDRILEGALRADYALTPKIRVFAEYQEIRVDFERIGNRHVDEGLRAGFEARF